MSTPEDTFRVDFVPEKPHWLTLSGLVLFSALVRIAMFSGPIGSDDTLYLKRAAQISQGVWLSSDYNGALRYGFNIPAGLVVHLLGLNAFTVNLWSLMCSLAEIAAVYLWAASTWGRRPALYSALIVACVPLHISVATRMNPDPVVSLFVTLSFVFFSVAERSGNRAYYLLTGAAMGMIFWTKELAVITFLAFGLYSIVWRKIDRRWGYVIAGGIPFLVAHLALMGAIAGDPFHAFKVVTGQIGLGFIEAGVGEDSPWFYFRYLFFDIRHTWLAPFFAAAVIVTMAWRYVVIRSVAPALVYPVFWLLSLVVVLSFTPVSLHPLRFALKQANYMSLFLAPIALLAGYAAARMPQNAARVLLVLYVIGGLFLGVLEQQAIRVFTSNSKAAAELALSMPAARYYGSTNNSNIADAYSLLFHDPTLAKRFGDLSELVPARTPLDTRSSKTFVVLDKETMRWGRMATPLATVPSCWEKVQTLVPVDLGLGHQVVGGLLSLGRLLPTSVQERIMAPVRRLYEPQLAVVYRIDPSDIWCKAGA